MQYKQPVVVDLGSITEHTFNSSQGNPEQSKSAAIFHLDWACETSSGSAEPNNCTNPEDPRPPGQS